MRKYKYERDWMSGLVDKEAKQNRNKVSDSQREKNMTIRPLCDIQGANASLLLHHFCLEEEITTNKLPEWYLAQRDQAGGPDSRPKQIVMNSIAMIA
jgi:hypothetical protein